MPRSTYVQDFVIGPDKATVEAFSVKNNKPV